MPDHFNALADILTWIISGGGAMVLAGYVMAYFFENAGWWHTLPNLVKTLVPMALAGLFAFSAQALLLGNISQVLAAVSPVIPVVILAFLNWLASQKAYIGIKDKNYAMHAKSPKLGP